MNQGLIRGSINAGCVVFIPEWSTTDRQKQDFADITLYTQLAASKKHSRFDEPQHWTQTWVAALSRFGWQLQSHERFSLPAGDMPTGTLWDWIRKHCPAFIPLALIDQMMEGCQRSMRAYPAQPAFEMLKHQAISPSDASASALRTVGLQVAGYEPSSGFCLTALTFRTCQEVGSDLLISTLDPQAVKGNVELAFYLVQMNELLYALYRDQIDQALTGRRAETVSPLWEVADERAE